MLVEDPAVGVDDRAEHLGAADVETDTDACGHGPSARRTAARSVTAVSARSPSDRGVGRRPVRGLGSARARHRGALLGEHGLGRVDEHLHREHDLVRGGDEVLGRLGLRVAERLDEREQRGEPACGRAVGRGIGRRRSARTSSGSRQPMPGSSTAPSEPCSKKGLRRGGPGSRMTAEATAASLRRPSSARAAPCP